VVDKYGDYNDWRNQAGTGPFMLTDYVPASALTYKRNPNYWMEDPTHPGNQIPYVETLKHLIVPDLSTREAAFRTGKLDLSGNIPFEDARTMLKANPQLKYKVVSGVDKQLWMRTDKQELPFKDVRVRQALNLAINKAAIIEAVFQGAGKAAKNPIPPTIWSYNDAVEDYPYDPDAAKKLLAEAGLGDGFETDIWAMPVQRPYNPNAQRMAELIQADWAAVGVKAQIVSFEWGEYLKRSQEGEHQTVLLGWTGDNGDPDNFLNTLLGCSAAESGTNRARWCDKEFDDLVVGAKRTADVAERTKLYEQAQVEFKKEAPWVTIAHSVVYMPMRKEVTGYKVDPFGIHQFYGVDLAE